MYEIEFTNQQEFLEINEDFLREAVRYTLAAEGVARAEISVALVDNEAIHTLNRQFLQHDCATDVLSFLLESEPPVDNGKSSGSAGDIVPRGAGACFCGEVVVSAEMALQTAVEYDWNSRDEMLLYLVHGLLHLCGYDDLTQPECEIMRAREREILRHWDLRPHFSAPAAGTESGANP